MTTPAQGSSLSQHELQPCKSSQRASQCAAARHGTSTAYREGCRCASARAVMARAQRARIKRRYLLRGSLHVDATGTQRRLHALMANGWPRRALAAQLGRRSGCLFELLHDVVHIDTAEQVRALYEHLADTPGPSNSSRKRAQAKGWLSPLWWDDDTIDDPAYTPGVVLPHVQHTVVDDVLIDRVLVGQEDPSRLNRAERQAAYQRLERDGFTRSQIARALHMSGGRVAQLAGSVRSTSHTHDSDNWEATG